MKRQFLLAISACLAFSASQAQPAGANKQQVPNLPIGWQMLSHAAGDGVYGAEVDRAYDFLKNRKPTRKVVVAVLDTGCDIEHEDLMGNIWTNPREIPGDGIDNDKNGFVDDIHGWNFLGTPNGKMLNYSLSDDERYYIANKDRLEALLANKERSEKEEVELEEMGLKFQRSNIGAAYWGLQNVDEVLWWIEWYDEQLKQKFPGEELNVDKLATLLDPNEKNMNRNVASYYLIVQINNLGRTWDDAVDRRFTIKERAEKEFQKASERFTKDERHLLGDDMNDVKDRFYGNSTLISNNSTHGTYVSGIIGAVRNNGIDMNGIADNVSIMVVRVSPNGSEYDKDIASGIRYAVDNGADIINMSFSKSIPEHPEWLSEAVKYANKKGVLIVQAVGNKYTDIDKEEIYPNRKRGSRKSYPNFITVGATNADGSLMQTTNYGRHGVDVFAPGESIYSLAMGDNYRYASGSNVACPVVTGIAAMLMSYFPDLKAPKIREIIVKSAVTRHGEKVSLPQDPYIITPPAESTFTEVCTGGGIISAYEAVRIAASVSKK